jgi:hypothetical protein
MEVAGWVPNLKKSQPGTSANHPRSVPCIRRGTITQGTTEGGGGVAPQEVTWELDFEH